MEGVSHEQLLAFMLEREAIRLRKERGHPWPWTDDPVLQRYKFTNVRREDDRVTRWMRANVTAGLSGGDLLWHCAYFRFVGCPDPFQRGDLPTRVSSLEQPDKQALRDGIRRGLDAGQKVFTAAYTIMKTGSSEPRERYVVDDVLAPLWVQRHELAAEMLKGRSSLEAAYVTLRRARGFGGTGFMAYEVVNDLRHTGFFIREPEDVMTWANAGPGAMRGLSRLLGRKAVKPAALGLMRELLAAVQASWPHGALELADVEHALCEFDKWSRVTLGEGVCRSLYRVTLS